MAKSRNERRKAAKERLLAKSERIARAEIGRNRTENDKIVMHNLASPIERNHYGDGVTSIGWRSGSNISTFAGVAHRGYVCRAGGGMGRRQALALKAKGSW